MNTKHELGNVLRSITDFTNYEFPNELPTEEWAGNEVRAYNNYIRPIANLFENDRENYALIKDTVLSDLYSGENAVISGCEVVKTGNYCEVKHGIFVCDGIIYCIYPNCDGQTKQLQVLYTAAGRGDLDLHISYDYDADVYSYTYTTNTVVIDDIITSAQATTVEGTANNAVDLLNSLITGLGLTDIDLTQQIILPILVPNNTDTKIYFNKTLNKIVSGTPETAAVYTELASIVDGAIVNTTVLSMMDGNRIHNATINNESLKNNTITIGTTTIELGQGSDVFTGVERVNSTKQYVNDKLHIEGYASGASAASYAVIADDIYELDTACEKEFTVNASLTEPEKLPTAYAVKTYVDDQINGNLDRHNNVTFLDGITLSSGALAITSTDGITSNSKLVINNASDAAYASSSVSGNASIFTRGGIEAKGAIYSESDIVGLNAGTYSKREYKENITPFSESALDLIDTVEIVNYNYKADKEHNHKVGFIADDTHEYFATKNHDIMDQSNCIGILLKAVQELRAENKALKARLDKLEK